MSDEEIATLLTQYPEWSPKLGIVLDIRASRTVLAVTGFTVGEGKQLKLADVAKFMGYMAEAKAD